MLQSYREAVCWLSTHEGAVLVVGEQIARVVDVHHHADGVNITAARALTKPLRKVWFSIEDGERRTLLRLNENGEQYHRQLVARRRCACPPNKGGE